MKVSIIVPVYNVENYIKECLESITRQTYTDLECIVVNDCSMDSSIDIYDEFVSQYGGSIVFKKVSHVENKGLSEARNTGLMESTGDAVFFMDSDDIIYPNTIRLLVDTMLRTQAEVVQGSMAHLYEDGTREEKVHKNALYVSPSEIVEAFTNKYGFVSAWNKLIKRDFLIEHNLLFYPRLLHEDQLWIFEVFQFIQAYAIISDVTYGYRVRPNSICTDQTKDHKRREDMLFISTKMLDILKINDTHTFYRELKYYNDLWQLETIMKILSMKNSFSYNRKLHKQFVSRNYELQVNTSTVGMKLFKTVVQRDNAFCCLLSMLLATALKQGYLKVGRLV